PVTLIVMRIFEGVGWAMLWPAIEAVIRDSTTDARRALSIFNFTWSGSATVGPLIGSAIVFVSSIREAFVVSSAVMIVTLLVNLAPLAMRRGTDVVIVRTTPISDHVQTPRYGARLYVPSMIVGAISVGVLYTFLPEYAKSIHISILLVGAATFIFGFTRFLVYVLMVRERFRSSLLHSKYRARNVVISLIVLSLSSLLMLVRDPSGLLYIVSYGVGGACYSVVYAVSQASVIAEAEPDKVGRSAGKFESSIGIGQALGPIMGGAIAMGSYSTPYIVPSLSLVVFLIVLPFLVRRRR
ncbi:MAG: MFS transporter, partial [Nitrososphaerota archaeon]|nr:MFS transporter [Nitrososphaerota archaeon]